MKKKILIVTERRADFSRFKPIIKLIQKSKLLTYDLIVTGIHLNRNFGYTKKERSKSILPTQKVINFLLNNGLNVLFNNVCLNKKAYNTWKKNIKNLTYVYIKTDVKKIIKFGKKNNIYKNNKNVVGVDIKPDIPRNPDIVIENNFDRPLNKIANELKYKLKKIL